MTLRPTKGFDGYTVTDDGAVYSIHGGRGRLPLHQTPNADGYPSVRLRTGPNTRKRIAVHKLVAHAFRPTPPPDGAYDVRHLDGDKNNNHASNLQWGTAGENASDREVHGRTSRGNGHSEAIKNSEAYRAHKRLIAAAPAMLEALQIVRRDMERKGATKVAEQLSEVIALATGEKE